jgi:hypothetical protein
MLKEREKERWEMERERVKERKGVCVYEREWERWDIVEEKEGEVMPA